MKKLFALLLALMMVFALVACDQGDTPGNTDNPGTSQGGEENPGTQGGENNNGGNETLGKEWPIDKYNWTGSGKIVDVTDNSTTDGVNFQAYVLPCIRCSTESARRRNGADLRNHLILCNRLPI